MSISDNKTSKFYSDVNPVATSQQEVNPQNYMIAETSRVEAYFLDEISKREKLAKKMQCLVTLSKGVGTRLVATAVIICCLPILVFASGWVLPIGMALYGMSYFPNIEPIICCKVIKTQFN